jgi:hypothetical protein
MPEHVARTHTQRALHSLLLDDNESARAYLLRALSSLNARVQEEPRRSQSAKCAKG